jgi:aspartyl-tRNA(Asn)/glutamyl-tRNA(Gln) amidotransferase subunit A
MRPVRNVTAARPSAGVPALALPCGFSAAGLPLGLQIMGRHFDEATVYRVAAAHEQATDWHTRRPVISAKA